MVKFGNGRIVRIRDCDNFSFTDNRESCEILNETRYKGRYPIVHVSETRMLDHYTRLDVEAVVCQYPRSDSSHICRDCVLSDRRKIRVVNWNKINLQ
jgi:hypothetical protein